MSASLQQWEKDWNEILKEFHEQVSLTKEQILIIGCSTSEIIGKKIGTEGSIQVAQMIFHSLLKWREKTGVHLAFQCCEHLNRAIVVERETAKSFQLEEVTVVPVPEAGGSMAAYAYNHFKDPVVVETIRADAGIDIGDTFIGMHLKQVAVPVRTSFTELGNAHITFARTRPKLIGGHRAVYEKRQNIETFH